MDLIVYTFMLFVVIACFISAKGGFDFFDRKVKGANEAFNKAKVKYFDGDNT